METSSEATDGVQLEKIANSFASLTTPKFSSSNFRATIRTGTPVDFAYDTYKSAAFNVRIGNGEHQDCGYFNNKVERNVNNILLYSARLSRSPFSMSKGPELDITLSETEVSPTNMLKVEIGLVGSTNPSNLTASLYIDYHPYEDQNATRIINENVLSKKHHLSILDLEEGEHVLYIQGTDVAGNVGIVKAAKFNVTFDSSLTITPTMAPTIKFPMSEQFLYTKVSETLPYPYDCFLSLEGVHNSMFNITEEYPHLAKVFKIGVSHMRSKNPSKGYDINALQVTNYNSTKDKSPLFIICNLQPSELSPPSACSQFAHDLVKSYGKDGESWILDYTDIYLIFQGNPDGRSKQEELLSKQLDREVEFVSFENLEKDSTSSSSSQGNFTKIKNMNQEKSCVVGEIGVNLNRNFPHSSWGDVFASSNNPCVDIYCGESPGSESETKAIVSYYTEVMENYPDSPGVFLDLKGKFTYSYKISSIVCYLK